MVTISLICKSHDHFIFKGANDLDIYVLVCMPTISVTILSLTFLNQG